MLDDFLYPGHSRLRMHAVPEKTGAALEARLLAAAEEAGIPVVTEARATRLYADGSAASKPSRSPAPTAAPRLIACRALVLACNGFGGNAALVRAHIPEIADGLYYGHAGNTGDALAWGEALGARAEHLSGYQGHGSLAHPHGILISWALMMEGGIQVNAEGERFSNEHGGYSEQAVDVLAQPGGIAWDIYRRTPARFRAGLPRLPGSDEAGAIREAADVAGLAASTGLPEDALSRTLDGSGPVPGRRGQGPVRPRLHDEAAARSALSCGQGHRRAVPHPGRADD